VENKLAKKSERFARLYSLVISTQNIRKIQFGLKMSSFGVQLAKIHELDRSRSGYQAVLTRLCNEIEKAISVNNIEDVKLLQNRLDVALQRYQQCCQQYDDLIQDTTSEKYRTVQDQFKKQQLRYEYFNQKISAFKVNFEVKEIEKEIQRTELKLRESLKQMQSTYNISVSDDSNSQDSDVHQEDDLTGKNSETIPPPPMFATSVTQEESTKCKQQTRVYTSTPIILGATSENSQSDPQVREPRYDSKINIMAELNTEQTVPLHDNNEDIENLMDITALIVPPPPMFSDLTGSQPSEDEQFVSHVKIPTVNLPLCSFGLPVAMTTISPQETHIIMTNKLRDPPGQGVHFKDERFKPASSCSLHASNDCHVAMATELPQESRDCVTVRNEHSPTPLSLNQMKPFTPITTSGLHVNHDNVVMATPTTQGSQPGVYTDKPLPQEIQTQTDGLAPSSYETEESQRSTRCRAAQFQLCTPREPESTGTPQFVQSPPTPLAFKIDQQQSATIKNINETSEVWSTNDTAAHNHHVTTERPKPTSESLLASIVETIDRMSTTSNLPHVQVVKFDGSPEEYLTFRQRFKQLVESRPIDEAIKMTRLLQFLEGPALAAVQHYETIPGGLQKALKILEDRFGRPYHVVKACVEAMTTGPVIQPNDRQALQHFADTVRANYDTLDAMGYLSEMNTNNLEKLISRLPKWMQSKFVERLSKLERKGQTLPSFRDVVEFLRDTADVVNHPFLSKSSSETVTKNTRPTTSPKTRPALPRVSSFATSSTNKVQECELCSKPHRLYHCDLFKSKSTKERNDFVKSKHLCFNCLSSTTHKAQSCKSTVRCRAPDCGRPHHTMLHFDGGARTTRQDNSEGQAKPRREQEAYIPSGNNNAVSSDVNATSTNNVLLQVLPIRVISNTGHSLTTYGLLDSGSDITMIDPSLVMLLGMKGNPSKLLISTINDSNTHHTGVKVDFKLAAVDAIDDTQVCVQSAWATKELAIPLKHTKVMKDADQLSHLKGVPFPDVERMKISVLIGTNVQEAFIPIEVRKGKADEPIAIRSSLGWSVLGGTCIPTTETANINYSRGDDITLNEQLQEFWKVESYGLQPIRKMPMSVEDQRAAKIIDDTICKDGTNYKMGLLWKSPNPTLPNNRILAEARLKHLKVRLQHDSELLVKYRKVMDDYLAKGYAVKLTEEEAKKSEPKTWYLPHHPVSNPNKPGKIRVVFDAAAKFGDTSLNDNLLQGPCLINDLTGVLIRFREEQLAFTADVEAMFHQVHVSEEDTEALRFLWWPDSLDDPPEEYKMTVHIFGAKSSPCCANKALRLTAADHADKYDPEVTRTVERNFYVDDVLKSASTQEQAIHLATELVKLLKEGGFHLSKFSSNSREVLSAVPKNDRADPTLDMDLDRLPIGRALGIHWDAESDMFQFKSLVTNKPHTKRGVLSIVSSLFDPLGFLAPLTFSVKSLLQDLWRAAISWDEELPEPYLSQWKKWLQSMPKVVNINIPRCFKSPYLSTPSAIELHVFADASRRGLAAVAYLRFLNELGYIHCSFVMGKAKNAPLREWTIPRLELQAAVLATRLCTSILKELDLSVDSTTFWTDSATVLQYIQNVHRRFPVFIANRLTEIHEVTKVHQWRHVPGSLNPADEGSRGVDIDYFEPGCRWLSGPEFLWQDKDKWPNENPEVNQADIPESTVFATAATSEEETQVQQLLRRYSSWQRLLRVMCWVLRFVNAVKRGKQSFSGPLKLTEMRNASRAVIQLVQLESFREEYNALEAQQPVKKGSKLSSLNPILIDGVLRVGGRVRNGPLPFDATHPMIIPKEHPIAELIVRYYHKLLGHGGREHVLCTLRQYYWILHGRSLVRQLLHNCIECRKRYAPTLQQFMADLPRERLTPFQPPFTFTGVDFFGPFYVKRGRATEKVYGCIFVCFNTRAIHVEDASALSTDAFIQAFRRFIAVRGCPKEMWSDNGTNFTGAEKELKVSIKEFNEEAIRKELHARDAEWHTCPMSKWKFQPPAASHMSGVWERLIRAVRKCMKGLLGNPNAPLALETLRTVFYEAASILNSRPLCPSSDDPKDLEPLTPNHFLLLRSNGTPPPGVFVENDLYSRKHWRHAQYLTNQFWNRWKKEYVPLLQQRHKWTSVKRDLKVDDLVLITDSVEPRSKWLLGRVIKVIVGKDNHVRSAEVRTKSSVLFRPVTKLCLLEGADS